MRIRTLWVAPALLAALGLVGVAAGGPGGRKGGPGGKAGGKGDCADARSVLDRGGPDGKGAPGKGEGFKKGGRGEAFQPDPGGRGPGGRGGPRDGFGPGPRDGFGPGGGVQRALDDLKLTGTKKEKAEAAAKTYQEDVRRLTDLARSDLLVKMQDIVSADEFKKFKEAADRRPGPGPGGPPGGFGGR